MLESHVSKDLKGSCRNLYMRGPLVENVSQTMDSDVVNYLKRQLLLMTAFVTLSFGPFVLGNLHFFELTQVKERSLKMLRSCGSPDRSSGPQPSETNEEPGARAWEPWRGWGMFGVGFRKMLQHKLEHR